MSVSLTDIASLTAWTCDFVNYSAGDLFWYFYLEGTYKRSYFPQGDNCQYWSFSFIQAFHKIIVPSLDVSDLLLGILCWVELPHPVDSTESGSYLLSHQLLVHKILLGTGSFPEPPLLFADLT